ncbi:phage replisome organizer N-terminal domain-containing protein [Pelosinus baikalensis]|uniref:Phage replisome organizer N-terminal domain-containing protein n=1 Tax=Pelosinus baikalensis TaxID=2892015 RepID=A0ABS8HSH9_9FIRM|nr:phage replisome organizer N-terminal domain-containing protein [Pelosinus baikalensis]MCC5465566.1 phage replisome organizer N-terminal domain-containing protein [Pelosinus baikalensis]
MAEIKWIKITTDMFDDEKIDFISSLPEGDSLIVVWVRLLTMAGKNNAGGFIFLTENIPYSEDMLSNKFKKPLNVIKLALRTFKDLEMIDFDDSGRLFISNWEKHQNIEALDKIREQTRLRVAKYREIKQLQCNVTVTEEVTPSNATDKEIDKEIDKEVIPCQDIIDYLNQKASTKFRATDKHKECIRARWKEGYGFDDFKTVIDKKYKEWAGTEQAKYIRPITLFGTKFDGYLNQVEGGSKVGAYQQSTRKAKATNITKPSTPTRSRKASEWED